MSRLMPSEAAQARKEMEQKRLERASKNYSTQGHQEEGLKYEQKRRSSRLVCMVREKV